MMKTKAAVALSIFSTLFAGAWWFNAEQKRDYSDQLHNPDSSIVLIGSNQSSFNVIQPFKPREYIRVVVAKNQEEEKQKVEPT